MVSAPWVREGTPSPRVLSPAALSGGPRARRPDDSLLGCGPPLSSLGASKEPGMLGRRWDTTECPRVPGQHGEGSSCSHAPPNPRSGNLKDGKKEGKRLHALQKVLQSGTVVGRGGCHVL